MWRQQLFRFASVGLLNTALHATVALYFIHFWQFQSTGANLIAFTVANTVSYLLNTLWSFSSTVNTRTASRFFSISIISLACVLLVSSAFDYFQVTPYFSVLALTVALPLVNFMAHKFWTYGK